MLDSSGLTLPIMPGEEWKPSMAHCLRLGYWYCCLPNFFMLASTGPLLTAWFNRVYPGRLPFRLYALSNIGSLLALLSYPFVFEPWLTSNGQGWFWTTGFGLFAVLCAGLAYVAAMTTTYNVSPAQPEINAKKEKVDDPSFLKQRLAWVLLPMLSSVILLAVTAHLCQDVAVIPFFWILPLSLYLLSFILCFDTEAWYHRRFFSIMFGFFLSWICLAELSFEISEALNGSIHWINQNTDSITIDYKVLLEKAYFSGYVDFNSVFDKLGLSLRVGVSIWGNRSCISPCFCLCMICHGELVRRKPTSQRLTEFYC
ncbi:MAG: hypothetical protein IPL27_06655 [Lewinellaceae bacterium]|nr:hypothetical protein [Lewinellaceae bacterium]